jgi:serine/threonine-protein kinase
MLDRFEIRSLLGVGGMGEVYRAHDTRLRRDVALKLLPADVWHDPGRRARFEREARLLASMSHPNIAAIHEILAVAGCHVLVLELVEGQRLSERIEQGAMPIPEALGIAVQIVAALEAAHDQGIIHRDLKPGNVMLRDDGTVKLLDFGLAKVIEVTPPGADSAAVTLTTLEGPQDGAPRILGSPTCMSPEQARGLPVDKRTDVWAFGCLLYEMLCGERAFQGDNAPQVIARILEREPDFTKLPPGIPAVIERLLRRCLEKDRRRRLRDVGDARLELLEVLEHEPGDPAATGYLAARASRRRTRRRGLLWLAAAGAIVSAASLAGWQASRPRPERASAPITRFAIAARPVLQAGVSISDDGTLLAYVTERGLEVRSLERLDSRVVAPSHVVQAAPFFSPDGKWLGFKGWDALNRVSVSGGKVTPLVDGIFPEGTWLGNDIIYGDPRGLFRIRADGGEPEQLLATEGVEQIVSVEAIAARRAVLFAVIPTRGNVPGSSAGNPGARIEALDLATGKSHVVLRGGGRPRYAQTGHLLYASGGTLHAVKFDIERLQLAGDAVPVLQTGGLLDFDVATNGTLIYRAATSRPNRELVWVDRRGREESLGAPLRAYLYPRISPDGQRVALDVNDASGERDTWIWDIRRATLELFTKDPAGNPLVAWSPDGSQLAFGSERSGVSNVYRQSADGSGEPEHLVDSEVLQMPVSYAPDGSLLISVGVAGQQRDLHLMNLNGDRSVRPLIHGPANELWAEVSPDGRWVAYDSDESGQFEVYVRPFPDAYGGGRWQLSSSGGRQPVWSRDGRELFYRDFAGAMISVPVRPGSRFSAGRPLRLFDGEGFLGAGAQGGGRTFDVSPDGARFLLLKNGPEQAAELIVVLNWFDELRRLAPLR